jgi:hypothetical protein
MGMDWILGVCGPTQNYYRPWLSPEVMAMQSPEQVTSKKDMNANLSGITSYVTILFNKRNFE